MDDRSWPPYVVRDGSRMDIYSSMLEDGIVFVNAPIDQRIAGLIASSVLHLNTGSNRTQHPKIYVNTNVGDVVSAMSVVDVIERFRRNGTVIETVGFGSIGIASTLIVCAGTPGKRRVAAHCQISLHMGLSSLGFKSDLPTDIQSIEAGNVKKQVCEMFVQYTKKPMGVVLATVENGRFLDAAAGVAFGIADETL